MGESPSSANGREIGYSASMRTAPQEMERQARAIYGFSSQAKEYVHKRARGHCEFPEGCEEKSTGKVNHLTGCAVAFRDGLDKKDIINPDQNALELCSSHEFELDQQESYQLECLVYEKIHNRSNKRLRRNEKRLRGISTSPSSGSLWQLHDTPQAAGGWETPGFRQLAKRHSDISIYEVPMETLPRPMGNPQRNQALRQNRRT